MNTVAALALIAGLTMLENSRAAEPDALTTVEEIRALTPDQAELHLPVELEGTVIYYDGIDDHAFLQDPTGSIFFRPGRILRGEEEQLALLDSIRIKGVTIQGMFSPSVAGLQAAEKTSAPDLIPPVEITKLGKAERTTPPIVTGQDIFSGTYHDQLVRIRGTVRAVEVTDYFGEGRLVLKLSVRRVPGLLRVEMPSYRNNPVLFVDAPCEITGIVAGGGDEQGRLHDVRILVPSPSDIQFDPAALGQGFSQAPREPGEIMKYDASRSSGPDGRVRVDGVVTYAIPGEGFYLGHRNEGLWIQSLQVGAVTSGDKVQVLGHPTQDGQRILLEDAIYKVVGQNVAMPAIPITAGEAASGKFSSSLVSIEGELLDEVTQGTERILFLAASGRRFTTKITMSSFLDLPPAPVAGSWIQVTGILEPGVQIRGIASNVSAFSLLARDSADIVVIRSPSWFTADRLKVLQLVTLSVVFFGVLWLWLLRRQVTHQSQLIEIQTAERTLIEERQRIARELHDTLEQQLAGVRYHLNALNQWAKDAPASVGQAIAATRAMLDHSRAEMRRSVFELRSPILEQKGLIGAIQQTMGTIAPAGIPLIEIRVEGKERRLERRTEFHLMRVVQEAITNAVKHAEASLIEATFTFAENSLRIDVEDDGKGFDATQPSSSESTKFGMLGIRERLNKIQGEMSIKSQIGEGTTVTITVSEKRPENS